MGVLEVAPGLYWSSIETGKFNPDQCAQLLKTQLLSLSQQMPVMLCSDDGKTEIDLGCYAEEGPAGVAHDLMAFKLNSSSGEQRRLPQVDEDLLCLSLSDYERIARDILKHLKRSIEELAIALKSKGLAVELYDEIDGGPPAPVAAKEVKPAAKRAVEPNRKILPPAGKRLKATDEASTLAPTAVAGPSKSKKSQKAKEPEHVEKAKEKKPAKEKTPAKEKKAKPTPSQASSEANITKIWLKSNPEFPLHSGKFPCYVKAKPLQHSYITLTVAVRERLFANVGDKALEVVSVNDPSVKWKAAYTASGGSRYLTQIAAFKKGLGLQGGDVVYFVKGEGPQQLKIGVWKQGSAEAEEFKRKLIQEQS